MTSTGLSFSNVLRITDDSSRLSQCLREAVATWRVVTWRAAGRGIWLRAGGWCLIRKEKDSQALKGNLVPLVLAEEGAKQHAMEALLAAGVMTEPSAQCVSLRLAALEQRRQRDARRSGSCREATRGAGVQRGRPGESVRDYKRFFTDALTSSIRSGSCFTPPGWKRKRLVFEDDGHAEDEEGWLQRTPQTSSMEAQRALAHVVEQRCGSHRRHRELSQRFLSVEVLPDEWSLSRFFSSCLEQRSALPPEIFAPMIFNARGKAPLLLPDGSDNGVPPESAEELQTPAPSQEPRGRGDNDRRSRWWPDDLMLRAAGELPESSCGLTGHVFEASEEELQQRCGDAEIGNVGCTERLDLWRDIKVEYLEEKASTTLQQWTEGTMFRTGASGDSMAATTEKKSEEELRPTKLEKSMETEKGPLELEAALHSSDEEESCSGASNPAGTTTVYVSTVPGSDFDDPEYGDLSVDDEQWLAACPQKTRQKMCEKAGRNSRRGDPTETSSLLGLQGCPESAVLSTSMKQTDVGQTCCVGRIGRPLHYQVHPVLLAQAPMPSAMEDAEVRKWVKQRFGKHVPCHRLALLVVTAPERPEERMERDDGRTAPRGSDKHKRKPIVVPWRREEPSVTWNDTRFARKDGLPNMPLRAETSKEIAPWTEAQLEQRLERLESDPPVEANERGRTSTSTGSTKLRSGSREPNEKKPPQDSVRRQSQHPSVISADRLEVDMAAIGAAGAAWQQRGGTAYLRLDHEDELFVGGSGALLCEGSWSRFLKLLGLLKTLPSSCETEFRVAIGAAAGLPSAAAQAERAQQVLAQAAQVVQQCRQSLTASRPTLFGAPPQPAQPGAANACYATPFVAMPQSMPGSPPWHPRPAASTEVSVPSPSALPVGAVPTGSVASEAPTALRAPTAPMAPPGPVAQLFPLRPGASTEVAAPSLSVSGAAPVGSAASAEARAPLAPTAAPMAAPLAAPLAAPRAQMTVSASQLLPGSPQPPSTITGAMLRSASHPPMSGPLLASPPPSHTEPQGRESPEGENDLFLWQEDLPGPVRIPRGPSPTPSWAAPPRSAASSRLASPPALTTLSEPVAVQPDAQPAGACAEPTTASSNMGMSNVKMPAPVRKPIRDWSEEDVSVFLMNLSTVPMDIIDVVHAHAITGAVLLSLTDEDLEGLNIEKFGHRRLLLLAAQELRRTVQARGGLLQAILA
ncbi:unnamed protein product [Durusdinium trenchii]|uniref:SAM domain-containing protein n=1 Tax=Durusdinium trenchii TaxID=1381693 RepID=A0ABP0SUY9_9DINO